MKRIFPFILLFALFSKQLHAQVNLQTGSATFSLPMFNWQDNKSRLNSIVALEYNSGTGLKVNDIASNIGQGWSLVCGGVISRMQVGEPDDQKPKEGAINDITKYPAGYLYNPLTTDNNLAATGCPKALANYPIYRDKNIQYAQHNTVAADRELDYFSFQFNGRTGMFVLDKRTFNASTGTGGVLLLGDSKMLVTFGTTDNFVYQGKACRTTITSFTIQDENGLIYKFTRPGLTKVLRTKYCDATLINPLTQPRFKSDKVYYESSFDGNDFVNPYIINEWCLTEIEDGLVSGRKILFSYNDLNINTKAGSTISYFAEKNYSIISYKTSISTTPQITSITYPDGHTASFNYNSTARVDMPGDYALASVDISYQSTDDIVLQSRSLARYQLNTTYFILDRYGIPVSDYEKNAARLCLQSVKKTGVDLKADNPSYIFDYYLGSGTLDDFVPPPFYYKKDVWGYYNGNKSVDFDGNIIDGNFPPDISPSVLNRNNNTHGLCFSQYTPPRKLNGVALNPNPGYAKNGLLKQIIYPTGGALNYEYAQNKATLETVQGDENVGGVHVSATKLTDGAYSNPCANPVTTQYNYVKPGAAAKSSLWGLEPPVTTVVMQSHYEPESKFYQWKFPTIFGGCGFRFQYPGILFQEDAIGVSSIQKFFEAFSTVMDVVNVITTIIDVVNVSLSGTPAFVIAVVIDIIGNLLDVALTCIGDHSKDDPAAVIYNTAINGVNPLPSQFSRVEVVSSNTAVTGKTVQQFTSSDDYAVWEATNPTYSMRQRFAYWAYGLPQITSVYDASGNLLQQTENKYDFENQNLKQRYCKNIESKAAVIVCETDLSCNCYVTKSSSQRSDNWEDPLFYNNPDGSSYSPGITEQITPTFYNIYTGRVNLLNTKERVYKKTDVTQFVETVTEYQYNELNYQVNKITTTQSNGDINYKKIKYNDEFGTPLFINLISKNIWGIPVTTVNSVNKNGQTSVLGETATEFITLANGDVKPQKTLEKRTALPVAEVAWQNYYSGNPSFKETQNFIYDANNNLSGLKDEGNHIVTNIYDYNDKYIIASVINADPSIDKPAYTSFETKNFGGWTFTGTANRNSSSSITGSYSLSISSGNSLSANINSAKPYKLSFWSNNANVAVNGSASGWIKNEPTINGFTYYEYDITSGVTSITITGTASIDELRLYPKTARMRTATYDPLIGKTSECDENNRVTYYGYDDLGRLQFIKDEYKNIVKMYEYNTINNPIGCPALYYNNACSEFFTKNNCASGYIGGTVIYNIPAGKYSSTISQIDADQQVQNEFNAEGQALANNTGSCTQLFYNDYQSQQFTKQNCPPGYKGTTIIYSVPANRYSTTSNKADANQLALDEITANGQSFANEGNNASCVVDNIADWQADDPAQTRCQVDINGSNTGHQEVLMIDVNPNSISYNQTAWKDMGPNTAICPFTITCNSSNCTGNSKKCINNICQTGAKIYTDSYWNGTTYICIYHYEWSDGSWSGNYQEASTTGCPFQ